jgi:translation initiation factor 2-alpha kinase 4
MAPHKTNDNHHQHNASTSDASDTMAATSPVGESLPVRPPIVSQLSETYEKAQEDEREVLKAVFMDDYEESEATGAWSVSSWHIFIHDNTWSHEHFRAWVTQSKSSQALT